MKHAPLVAVLGAMCALPLAAQTITVTKPVAGATCTKGQACAIAWTVTGQPGSTGIIELLEETTTNVVRVIKSDAQIANLQYSWTVPNDVAAGKYRVRVRVAWLVVSPPGGVFTIKAKASGMHAGGFDGVPVKQNSADVHAGGIPGTDPSLLIRISDPTVVSVWTIGETYTIRWQAYDTVKYPLSLFLVSADHTTPIVDIGKVGSPVTRRTEKAWTVPASLYDQKYCVRITSADGAVQVHSQAFQIKASRIVKFDVPPSSVANKMHWEQMSQHSYLGEFSSADRLANIPDPGGSVVKFGYQRWYEDDGNHWLFLHRSFVKFNLANVIAQLKGKATVKSCSLTWTTTPNSPQPACSSAMFCLDAPMPNLLDGMFGLNFLAFPKHLVAGDAAVRLQMAQRWLDDPSKNYGTVVLAANEGQTTENGQCVRFTNILLKLEVEEKLNN